MQEESVMFAEERREKILALLNEDKRVIAKDLAEKFQISIDTIRRDLSILGNKGLLNKTHGGAIPAMQVRQAPLSPEKRYGKGTPHGQAITKVAATYIRENDTVFIGSGSLSYVLLEY